MRQMHWIHLSFQNFFTSCIQNILTGLFSLICFRNNSKYTSVLFHLNRYFSLNYIVKTFLLQSSKRTEQMAVSCPGCCLYKCWQCFWVSVLKPPLETTSTGVRNCSLTCVSVLKPPLKTTFTQLQFGLYYW